MSTSGTFIDFARLRPPTAIEALGYEAQLAAAKARLKVLLPSWDVDAIESDPANKLLEVACYLDLLLRARINDAIKSMLLAYATGADLEQLGANVNVARLPGEDDTRLRARVQTGLWAHTATGNPAAYRWHAMSVSTRVIDVGVEHRTPGGVDVVVLGQDWVVPAGADPARLALGAALFPELPATTQQAPVLADAGDALLTSVRTALLAEDVAPLTDAIAVLAPVPVLVPVTASLALYPGPDAAVVLADALAALTEYRLSIRRVGFDCTRSGLLDALTVAGVRSVTLTSPATDVVCSPYQVAVTWPISVTVAETRDV